MLRNGLKQGQGRPRFTLREPPLRIILVFILTLVFPSVLLSAFAVQAVEAQRQATLAERSSRLQDAARERVGALHAEFLLPARAAERDIAALGSASTGDLARGLAQLVERRPLLADAIVFDRDGQRLIPAAPTPARQGPRWPQAAVASLGGVAGGALALDPAALLTRVRSGHEVSLPRLRAASAQATPLVRRALLFELGRLLEREVELPAPLLDGASLTSQPYEELVRLPVSALDIEGRPVAALARFRQAQLQARLQPDVSRRALMALLDDLEAAHDLLPQSELARVGDRVAALLDGPAAAGRVAALNTKRRASELRAQRIEGIFGRVLVLASHKGSALPRISVPSLEGANLGSLSYLKSDNGAQVQVLTYSIQPSSQRLIALSWNAERLSEAFAERRSTSLYTGELVGWSDSLESSSELGVARLIAPFDHLGLVLRPRPASDLPAGALDLPQGTVQLWAIGFALMGIVMGVLLTTRTVQRESKEAQLKSDFVSNVTHELKTPLTSIQMFLETLLLGRVKDEEEVTECLQVMDREARRLTRLIEQLLVFSQIESRKWRVRFSSEDPRELVAEAIKILADQLHTTPEVLKIEVVAVQDLPEVAVDRFAFVEALLNLLHNAWKYSPDPDRSVRVVLTQRRRYLEIAVEDNGMGVPRGDRRRIFVKFERARNAEKSRVEGSGIGLALASEIIRGHGGRIRYAPLKPKGSRFSVFLPR